MSQNATTSKSTTLIVAHAAIRGDVQVESSAPQEALVARGQDLSLRFTYRFEEASHRREDCHLRLTSSLDGNEAKPAELKLDDKPGWPDESWGSVQQHYPRLEPGRHVLHFCCEVWLRVRDWRAGDTVRLDSRKIEGTVTVLVE